MFIRKMQSLAKTHQHPLFNVLETIVQFRDIKLALLIGDIDGFS